jgi:hypothetical protein
VIRNDPGTMTGDRPRMQHAPRRWPWPVAAFTLVLFVFACLFYPDARTNSFFIAVFGSIVAAFVVVGALLAARVPANPVGLLLLGSGVSLAGTIAAGSIASVVAQEGGGPTEVLAVALVVNEIGFVIPIVIVLIGIPLIFPDGRLLSSRWRWVIVLAVAALVADLLSQVLMPGAINDTEVQNPFAPPGFEGLAEALDSFASWTSVVGFGSAVLALVLRYRRGDAVQRHQVKWLVAVAVVAGVAFPIAFLEPSGVVSNVAFFVGLVALFALPCAIGVAVLRYRLYEIDRLISRTIGWTIISGVLVAAFAILVVGLQAVLANQTQGQTLAVAASTLAAFALFQPVRGRVQAAVDRRFDRARYDAQRTADAFAERLRDEVELGALADELEGTVRAAIRPSVVGLWLPPRDRAS